MVLVRDHGKEAVTDKGIIIPDVAQTPEMKGTVVAVGKGTSTIPMVVEVGKTVLFHHKAGNKITINDEEYRLMAQKDVFFMFDE